MIFAIQINDEFKTDKGRAKVLWVQEDDTVIALGENALRGTPLEAIEYLNKNNAIRCPKKT